MARKKGHRKTGATHRRRGHRVGSAGKAEMSYVGMMFLGGALGGIAATALQRTFPNVNPKIVSVGQMTVGGLVALRGKSPFLKGVGYGIGVAGTVNLAHEVGLLKGAEGMIGSIIGASSDMYPYQVGGLNNGNTLAGLDNGNTLGYTEIEEDIYNPGVLGGIGAIHAHG